MGDPKRQGARGLPAFALGVHLAETATAAPVDYWKAEPAADAGSAFLRRSSE